MESSKPTPLEATTLRWLKHLNGEEEFRKGEELLQNEKTNNVQQILGDYLERLMFKLWEEEGPKKKEEKERSFWSDLWGNEDKEEFVITGFFHFPKLSI